MCYSGVVVLGYPPPGTTYANQTERAILERVALFLFGLTTQQYLMVK